MHPLCNSYLQSNNLNEMEAFYPLRVYVCGNCFLVQLEDTLPPEDLFTKYAYFSSHSKGWLKHSEAYAKTVIAKFGLNQKSQVIEIGSNDGYLVKHFVRKNIPVLGIEPATNVAEIAIKKKLPTIIQYFGMKTALELVNQGKTADLLIGNNVIDEVPDLNDFVAGMKILLKPSGVITLEFYHLMNLIDNIQFDTIRHERYSYLSFTVIEKIFDFHNLKIFDVKKISTHSGSLRIYGCHKENSSILIEPSVKQLREKEKEDDLAKIEKYLSFSEKVKKIKRDILNFLVKIKQNKKSIVGYGAHAEAQTFLNYCCIGNDFIDYTVDRNPVKQGKFIAGKHIPIFSPEKIYETKPDYLLILVWTLKKEIMSQMLHIGKWGGHFIVAIPKVEIYISNKSENCSEFIIKEKN